MDSDDDWFTDQISVNSSIHKPVFDARMQAQNMSPMNTPSGKKSTVTNIVNMFKGIGIVQSYLNQAQDDQDQSQSNIKKKIGTGFLMGKNKIMTSARNLYFEEQQSMATYVVFYPEQNNLLFSEQRKSVKSKNFAINESYKFSKNQSNFTQNYGTIFVESSPQNLSGSEPYQFDWTYDEDENAKNDLMIYGYRMNNQTKTFQKSVKNFKPSKKSHGIIFGASSIKLSEGQEGSPLLIKQKNEKTGKIQVRVVGLVTKHKQSSVAIEFGYLTQSKQVTKKQINALGSQMLLSYKMTPQFRLLRSDSLKQKQKGFSEPYKKSQYESLLKQKSLQLKQYQTEIEKLYAEGQRYKTESQRVKKINASTALQLGQALEKIQSMQKQIESIQQQHNKKLKLLQEQNVVIQINSKLQKNLETATKKLEQKQKQLVISKNQIQKLTEQSILQKSQIEDKKKQIQEKNAQISELIENVQQLKQLNQTNNQQRANLQKTTARLQNQINQLKSINEQRKKKITQLLQNRNNLNKAKITLELQNKKLLEQIQQINQDYKVQIGVDKKKNKNQELISLKRELEQLKNKHQISNREKQTIIDQLKQKVQFLQDQNQFLKQQKDEAENQSPQQYVTQNFPSQRQNDYYNNTQNQINNIINMYNIQMSQEGYVLNHSSIYIIMTNFLKYDWSTLESLNLTDCNIIDKEWRQFVQSAEKFSNLIVLELTINPIIEIKPEDFDDFKSLRLVFLDEEKFNEQQRKAFKEYGQNNSSIVFKFI